MMKSWSCRIVSLFAACLATVALTASVSAPAMSAVGVPIGIVA